MKRLRRMKIYPFSESMDANKTNHTVENFLHVVRDDVFVAAAEELLDAVDDPITLSMCAQLATERQYGGALYQALLWSKVFEICDENINEFKRICKSSAISFGNAMKLVEVGKAFTRLSERGENVSLLQHASNLVIANAIRQKDHVLDYLSHSISVIETDRNVSHFKIHNLWCKQYGSIKSNLDIIKPSDWWAFGRPKWERAADFPGSIPGEIYANALYYFAPSRGIVADPMAGSGMLKRVYDDRERWQLDRRFRLEIDYYDLYPKRDFIEHHDATEPLPRLADWIFLDPPYFGQSDHLFSGVLSSTTNYVTYLETLKLVIRAMVLSLKVDGILCIFLPKWSGYSRSDSNRNIPADAVNIAEDCGLKWIDFAVVSRGRQQEPNGARMNIRAKSIRRMRSDTCILNVLQKV